MTPPPPLTANGGPPRRWPSRRAASPSAHHATRHSVPSADQLGGGAGAPPCDRRRAGPIAPSRTVPGLPPQNFRSVGSGAPSAPRRANGLSDTETLQNQRRMEGVRKLPPRPEGASTCMFGTMHAVITMSRRRGAWVHRRPPGPRDQRTPHSPPAGPHR